jgi:uncharacterized protein YbjQ (UPF0145 family)
MSETAMIKSATGAITGFHHQILITTAEQVAQRKVVRVVGLVRGNAVRARHVGRDILAAFRNIVGGEIREYTKLLGEAREQALDRMAEQAVDLGANAVISMRFTTSMVMGGAAELLAYGTAVVIEQA